MKSRRSTEEILGGMAHHIEILEKAHGEHFSVNRLRALHDELMGVDSRSHAEVPQMRVVVPFPQNIRIEESGRVLQASKRNPDSHLGAEGA